MTKPNPGVDMPQAITSIADPQSREAHGMVFTLIARHISPRNLDQVAAFDARAAGELATAGMLVRWAVDAGYLNPDVLRQAAAQLRDQLTAEITATCHPALSKLPEDMQKELLQSTIGAHFARVHRTVEEVFLDPAANRFGPHIQPGALQARSHLMALAITHPEKAAAITDVLALLEPQP